MIKTETIKDAVATLNTNAAKITALITDEFASNSDARSSHTFYGFTEQIIEDIESANGILALILDRIAITNNQFAK